MANVRIIDQPSITTLSGGEYLVTDSATAGTKKITPQNLVAAAGGGGAGLTEDIKQALLQIAGNVAYLNDADDYYQDLYDALYSDPVTSISLNTNSITINTLGGTSQLVATTVPAGVNVSWGSSDTSIATVSSSGLVTSVAYGSAVVTASAGSLVANCDVLVSALSVVSISAVYTQSGTVYTTTSLDSLKSDLVVTATWSDTTSSTVASSDYTLSGTLTVGTSTITVSYGGQTTTFTVTVTAAPTVVGISAVYTQSGTVYTNDSLDTLKADLVVTATYSDTSTETVPSTGYTLSGTLTEGTSTITVTYEEATTTFTVTVTAAPRVYLYNWDFTQSLVDSVSSVEAVVAASEGTDPPSRSSSGLSFNAATQRAYLGQINMPGKTIEIDVANFDFKGSTAHHVRFLMNAQYTTGTSYGLGALIWRCSTNVGWTSYGWSGATGTSRTWSSSLWNSNLAGSSSSVLNAFNGKTVKVVYGSDGHTQSLYLDDVLQGTLTDVYFNNPSDQATHRSNKIYLGGIASSDANSGDQCYDMTITGVRVYEND